MDFAATVWFVLMVIFLVVEAACPIHLVSIWFAVGSLVAAVASLLGAALWLQITLFLVVSGALLLSLWPFVRKFLKPQVVKTNVDAIVGSQGFVTADINNLTATGQVKLGAMEWAARSSGGEPIKAGTLVKVDRIEGVKAFVSEVNINAEVH
ncbi:MAG: NfeD family protein [Oscillospiraceae bacterium]|nr:NfeD family protein [Oscillospiraceae bacterium]